MGVITIEMLLEDHKFFMHFNCAGYFIENINWI